MKIALASDHGGYLLKEAIKAHLGRSNMVVVDLGTDSEEAVDYPEFALAVAEGVATGAYERGILVCGTGIGMCMVANKVPGVRASLCNDVFSAKASREHNDANVLTLGARVIGEGLALAIVDTWLSTEFAGGRHARRVGKMDALDQRYRKE